MKNEDSFLWKPFIKNYFNTNTNLSPTNLIQYFYTMGLSFDSWLHDMWRKCHSKRSELELLFSFSSSRIQDMRLPTRVLKFIAWSNGVGWLEICQRDKYHLIIVERIFYTITASCTYSPRAESAKKTTHFLRSLCPRQSHRVDFIYPNQYKNGFWMKFRALDPQILKYQSLSLRAGEILIQIC